MDLFGCKTMAYFVTTLVRCKIKRHNGGFLFHNYIYICNYCSVYLGLGCFLLGIELFMASYNLNKEKLSLSSVTVQRKYFLQTV